MDNIVERIKQSFAQKASKMEKRVDARLSAVGLPGQDGGKFTISNANNNGVDPETKSLPQGYLAGARADRLITGSGEGPEY